MASGSGYAGLPYNDKTVELRVCLIEKGRIHQKQIDIKQRPKKEQKLNTFLQENSDLVKEVLERGALTKVIHHDRTKFVCRFTNTRNWEDFHNLCKDGSLGTDVTKAFRETNLAKILDVKLHQVPVTVIIPEADKMVKAAMQPQEIAPSTTTQQDTSKMEQRKDSKRHNVSKDIKTCFQLFVPKRCGEVQSVSIISDSKKIRRLDVHQHHASRIWKSDCVTISKFETIKYKYQVTLNKWYIGWETKDETCSFRTVQPSVYQWDVYENQDVAEGHFAFISLLMADVTTQTVIETLELCKRMGFPGKDMTKYDILQFIKDEVLKGDYTMKPCVCAFCIALIGILHSTRYAEASAALSGNRFWVWRHTDVPHCFLHGLQQIKAPMFSADFQHVLKNICIDLLSTTVTEVCWVDVIYFFYPLFGREIIYSLVDKDSNMQTFSQDIDPKRVIDTILKLCESPDSLSIAEEIIGKVSSFQVAVEVYLELSTLSTKCKDDDRNKLLMVSSKKVEEVLHRKCLALETMRYYTINAVLRAAILSSQLEGELKQRCVGIMENRILEWIGDVSKHPPDQTLKDNFLELIKDTLLFSEGESKFELLHSMAKCKLSQVQDLLVTFLDLAKFNLANSPPDRIQLIATQWMKTIEDTWCGKLQEPIKMCKYYDYLSVIEESEIIMKQCKEHLDHQAFQKLQKFPLKSVFSHIGSMKQAARKILLDHIAEYSTESLVVSNYLLFEHDDIDERLAKILMKALDSTHLARLNDMDLQTSMQCLQEEFFPNLTFWNNLMNARGNFAKKVWSHFASQNIKKVINCTACTIHEGALTLKDFWTLRKLMVDNGENLCMRICGEMLRTLSNDPMNWSEAYEAVEAMELKRKADFDKIKAVLQYLKKFQDHLELSDFDDMQNKLKNCSSALEETGDVLISALQHRAEDYLGPLAELQRCSEALGILLKSAVFQQITEETIPILKSDSRPMATSSVARSEFQQNALQITCAALCEFLQRKCKERYVQYFNEVFFQADDVPIEKINKTFSSVDDIPHEIRYAQQILSARLPEDIQEGLTAITSYQLAIKHLQHINTVLNIFDWELEDTNLEIALELAKEYQQETKFSGQQLSQVRSTYNSLLKGAGCFPIKDQIWELLEVLANSVNLMSFLNEIKGDLRNLVDAVEEYSEQRMAQSTVSDFIQVKRFDTGMKSATKGGDVKAFILHIGQTSLNSREMTDKLRVCNDNLFGLKALYHEVANRGEVSREVIRNACNLGIVRIKVGQDNHQGLCCSVSISYNVEGRVANLDEGRLDELQSRALLLCNVNNIFVEAGELEDADFKIFIAIADEIMKVKQHLIELHGQGHFQFKCYDRCIKGSREEKTKELKSLVEELHTIQMSWQDDLITARNEYPTLKFVYGEQFWILDEFFSHGYHIDMVRRMLNAIYPEEDIEEKLLASHVPTEKNGSNLSLLLRIGECIERAFGSVKFKQRPFPEGIQGHVANKIPQNKIKIVQLKQGSRNVIPVILSVYHATTGNLPEPWQMIICHTTTSWNELDLFLQRCKQDQTVSPTLFCLANVDMLSDDVLNKLIVKMKSMSYEGKERKYAFWLAVLCRGDLHHPIVDQFYQDVLTTTYMPPATMKKVMDTYCPDIIVVTSDVPGIGKSEYIKQRAIETRLKYQQVTFSGQITRENLMSRMMNLDLDQNTFLHLDLRDTMQPELVDNFLFELLLLGQSILGTKVVKLWTSSVAIEVANTLDDHLMKSLSFTSRFQTEHLKWLGYNDFHIDRNIRFLCQYLKAVNRGDLDEYDIDVPSGEDHQHPIEDQDCRELLKKYFPSDDMSLTIANNILKVLHHQLMKLSSSPFFKKDTLRHMVRSERHIKSIIVKKMLSDCIEFSKRSLLSCHEMQERAKHDKYLDEKELELSSEKVTKRMEGMVRWDESNHFMIFFHPDCSTISPLYRDPEKVDKEISKLLASQGFGIMPERDSNELQDMLVKMAHPLNAKTDTAKLQEVMQKYVLTPDNLLKMMLVLLRIQAKIPVIIMGETGCGKTSLLRYLATVCGVDFNILPMHAGTTYDDIFDIVTKNNEKALVNEVWVFFDEINTCEHMGFLSEILCHKTLHGNRLRDNLVCLAACNPYRLRSKNSYTAGLYGKLKHDEMSELVYRVHPLPENMIDYVWDYGTLEEADEYSYISRMVQRKPKIANSEQVVKVLKLSQAFVRKLETVSLRDVDRCLELMVWFREEMLREKAKHPLDKSSASGTNECVKPYVRIEDMAVLLALAHCYLSRLDSDSKRKEYLENISKEMFQHIGSWEVLQQIICHEQDDILNRMKLPPETAKNTALRENVFVVLVCILNRMPVFVIGKPGSSKSLALQLLKSNLLGDDSSDEYFKTLPALLFISYQGSESSTSKGIFKVFQKAESNIREKILPVVLLDEKFNPLKVLHNLLEPISGRRPHVAVVGISNWALDPAKMNLAIHLSRPDFDADELFRTGSAIASQGDINTLLQDISSEFHKYQSHQMRKHFHGLRDFYYLVKYIDKSLNTSDLNDEEKQAMVQEGIQRNFGGLRDRECIFLKDVFKKHFNEVHSSPRKTHVTKLLKANLTDANARHLMVITDTGMTIEYLEDVIQKQKQECVKFVGSMFEDDQTEDYSYRVLSQIILLMEQGCVLLLKDLEPIYGSLYDMLNQNYVSIGDTLNCRIALGPYSNPMCQVHKRFRCIVVVDENKVDYSDPPFLNRFEKHLIHSEDILSKSQEQDIEELSKWIHAASTIRGHTFTAEDCFMEYGENVLPSLVLQLANNIGEDPQKSKEIQGENVHEAKKSVFQRAKTNILWTISPAAIVRLCHSDLNNINPNEVRTIVEDFFKKPIHHGLTGFLTYIQIHPEEARDTMPKLYDDQIGFKVVVYTNSSLHADYKQYPASIEKVKDLKLVSLKSDEELSFQMKLFWKESADETLVLHCDGGKHLLQVKYQIEHWRNKFQTSEKLTPKNVCIVMHLNKSKDDIVLNESITYLSGWQVVTIDDIEWHGDRANLDYLLQMDPSTILGSNTLPIEECIEKHLIWAFTCLKTQLSAEIQDMLESLNNSHNLRSCLAEYILMFCREEYNHPSHNDQMGDWSKTSWQWSVACSVDPLEVIGTFRRSILHYMTNVMKKCLAKLVYKLTLESSWIRVFGSQDEDLKNLWITLMPKLTSIEDITDPYGLECYSVDDYLGVLKFPFSKNIFNHLSALQHQFEEEYENITDQFGVLDENGFLEMEHHKKLLDCFKVHVHIETDVWNYLQTHEHHVDILTHDLCNIVTCQYGDIPSETRCAVANWVIQARGYEVTDCQDKIVTTMFTLLHEQELLTDIFQLISFCHADQLQNMLSFLTHQSEGMDDTPEDQLVLKLIQPFLLTFENIDNDGLMEWQLNANKMMALTTRFSSNPIIQSLRLCNDYVIMIQCQHRTDIEHLRRLSQTVVRSETIASVGVLRTMNELLQLPKSDHTDLLHDLQLFICQSMVRILQMEPSQEVIQHVLQLMISMAKDTRNEVFLGPVLFSVLSRTYDEDDDSILHTYVHILNSTKREYPKYVKCLDECIKHNKNEDTARLVTLCSDTVQTLILDEIATTKLHNMPGNHQKLEALENAMDILHVNADAHQSLELSIATAYIKSFLGLYAKELASICFNQHKAEYIESIRTVTEIVCSLLNDGGERNPKIHIIKCYLIECIKMQTGNSLLQVADVFQGMGDALLTLYTSVPMPKRYIIQTAGYNPLSFCDSFDDVTGAMEHLMLHGEINKFRIDKSLCSTQYQLALLACAMESFYIFRISGHVTQHVINKGKELVNVIANEKKASESFLHFLECLLGIRDFQPPLMHITEGSAIESIHQATFVCSLLSWALVNNKATTIDGTKWDASRLKGFLFPSGLVEKINGNQSLKDHGLGATQDVSSKTRNIHVYECTCKCRYIYSTKEHKCDNCGKELSSKKPQVAQTDLGNRYMSLSQLAEPDTRFNNLSMLSFRVCQLFLHGSMMCSPENCQSDSGDVNMTHQFQETWQILRKLLNCSSQELFHKVCCLLWKFDKLRQQGIIPCQCHSADDFRNYESMLGKVIEETLIKELGMHDYLSKVAEASQFRHGEIESLSLEVLPHANALESEIRLMQIFRRVKPRTLEHFVSCFRTDSGSRNHPFLELYLKYHEELALLNCIRPILKWHQHLLTHKCHRLRRNQAHEMTIGGFLKQQEDKGNMLECVFGEFETAWNAIVDNEITIKARQQGKSEKLVPISRDTRLEICVISGEDNPIFQILKILVIIQNEFLHGAMNVAADDQNFVLSFTKTDQQLINIPIVPLHRTVDSHITHDASMNCIWKHSEWSTEYGYGNTVHYNWSKIEAEIANQILPGKVFLKESQHFPFFVYSGEIMTTDFDIVQTIRERFGQSSLPKEIKESVGKNVVHPEFLENLKECIEIVIYFLKMAQKRGDAPLEEYAAKWLPAPAQEAVKNVLKMCNADEDIFQASHVAELFVHVQMMIAQKVADNLPHDFRSRPNPSSMEALSRAIDMNPSALEKLETAIYRLIAKADIMQDPMKLSQPVGILLADAELWTDNPTDGVSTPFDGKQFLEHLPSDLKLEHLHHVLKHIKNKQQSSGGLRAGGTGVKKLRGKKGKQSAKSSS